MPGDLGHTGFGNPAVEAAIEIAGLDRRAMTTGEDQPGLDRLSVVPSGASAQ